MRLIIIICFSLICCNSILNASNNNFLNQSVKSVVRVYALSSGSKAEVAEFLYSNSSVGDKGSGIIIDKSGLIVTNRHVIAYKKAIKIVLEDGRIFSAKVLAEDSSIDLALLKLEIGVEQDDSLQPIQISKDDNLQVGDQVFAIGNPFGIGLSVSSGIISALPTNNEFASIGNLIQTDAAINPGNSGGALIDAKGKLIGINTGKFGNTFVGIGFAMPSRIVELFVARALAGKKVRNYWLGFNAVNMNYRLAKKFGMDFPKGVIITQVYQKTPASISQLRVGDIVLSLNDKTVSSIASLAYQLALVEEPKPMILSILRNKVNIIISIIPSIPNENIPKQTTKIIYGVFEGLSIANNSYAIAYEVGSQADISGVVVYDIRPQSILSNFGLQKADIIREINGVKITNVDTMLKFLKEYVNETKYTIDINRNSTDITINLSHGAAKK